MTPVNFSLTDQSSAPSLAQALPYKILLKIFKCSTTARARPYAINFAFSVCPSFDSDYRHLWRAALVCKNWRAAAQEVLYSTIIDLEDEQNSLLDATLEVRPDLIKHIRIFQYFRLPISNHAFILPKPLIIRRCHLTLQYLVLRGFLIDLDEDFTLPFPALKSFTFFPISAAGVKFGNILNMGLYPNLEVVSLGWSQIDMSNLSFRPLLRLRTLIVDAEASSLGTRPIISLAPTLVNLSITTTTTRLAELIEVFSAHSSSLRRLSILGEFYEDEEFTRLFYSSLSEFENLISLSIPIAGNSPSILPSLPSSLQFLELDFGTTPLTNDFLNNFFRPLEKELFKCSINLLRLVSESGNAFGLDNLAELPPDCLFWFGERGIEVNDCDKLASLYELFELS